MRLVYQQACMTRIISFEYLNRQLVWHELSEVLLFALPLLDALRMRRALATYLPRLPSPAALLGTHNSNSGSSIEVATAASALAAERKDADWQQAHAPGPHSGHVERSAHNTYARSSGPCPICTSTEILLPYVALPCSHVFCYYCLRANCEADEAFACPVDNVRISAMQRWVNVARS